MLLSDLSTLQSGRLLSHCIDKETEPLKATSEGICGRGGNSVLSKLGKDTGGIGGYEGMGKGGRPAMRPGSQEAPYCVGLESQGAFCLPWERWREHGESGV